MRNPDHLDAIWRDSLEQSELCVTVTEWADKYRVLPENASSMPGRWRTSTAPYLRGIQDALSVDNPAVKVVIVKSNQVGGSEAVVLNQFGYRIHQFPGPLQLVVPRDEDVKEFVNTRFDPMIAATPELAARVGRGEDGDKAADNVHVKRFPGGQLVVAASRSPATFRAKPVEVIVLDDLDACSRNNPEGDIVELAAKRTNTFSDRPRKIVLISTPTVAGNSPIEREFEWSTQQYFYVPCPHCGEFQHLIWEQVVYERNDPATARYRCRRCAADIPEDAKLEMLAAGHWRAHKPEQASSVGFHINALYSPWRRWSEVVDGWLQAQHALRAEGDTEKLMTWYNLEMGRSFVMPDAIRLQGLELELYQRREPPFHVPSLPIELITAGVDVQADRVEIGIWGWGPGKERWSLGHEIVKGSPEVNETWDEVLQVILGYGCKGVCVDTGSYTQTVQDQVKRLLRPLLEVRCAVWGVKGEDGKGSLWPAKKVLPGETVIIRIDAAKDLIFGSLERVKEPGPGYIHVSNLCDEGWFKQLFSERPAVLTDRTRARYVKIDGRRRNEVLDCAVYATSALYGLLALDPRLAPRMLDVGGALAPPSGGGAGHGGRPGLGRRGRGVRGKRPRWL
jgi:phage terminase large subunit GpA-like protein